MSIVFVHPLWHSKLKHHQSKISNISTFEKVIKRKIGREDLGHVAPVGVSDENDAGQGIDASMPVTSVDDSFERRVLLEETNEGDEQVWPRKSRSGRGRIPSG